MAALTTTDLTLITTSTEPRVDSRLLARRLDNKHRHSLRLVDQYLDRFQKLGKVCFKNAPLPGSKTGQSKLVQAFGAARRAADIRKTEYLPGYHELHNTMHVLANGSPNERHVHINANRLLNKFAGIEPGQRANAALPQQALLIVGQLVAANAVQGAVDHHDGYQRIKATLQALGAVAQLEVASHD